jgi:hypothetical protein
MKKSMLLIAAFAFSASVAFAQDLTSKKGEAYLPAAGDWSIGIDATPVLNYVGGFLSSAGGVAPTWDFLNGNQTITGKMYKSESTAYRLTARIGMTSGGAVNNVSQDGATPPAFPATPAVVQDEMKVNSHSIGLGAGIEKRRGKTRLQGFYGADAMFWIAGSKSTYTYGNAYSATNVAPTSTNFGTNIAPLYATWGGRETENKSGSTIGFAVRAFIGAEYFIMPKISIGAEFGWGLGFARTGEGSGTCESITAPGTGQPTTYVTSGKSSGLMFDTDRNAFGSGNGSLRMNFHF